MDSTRTFGMLALVTLGGCIISYDYEDKKPVGTSASSSAGSSGGTSGNVPTYACDYGTCLSNEWAKRYGADTDGQAAVGLAFDSVGNIVVAGNYDMAAFEVGGFSVDPLTTPVGDGFLAWIKKDGSNAVWAGSLKLGDGLPASVESLAVNGLGNAIAVGSGFRSGSDLDARVQKRNSVVGSGTNIAWIKGAGEAKAHAVATAGSNIYIVGTSMGEILDCNDALLSMSGGMFIASYTDDGMKLLICNWIRVIEKSDAIPAAVAAASGKIWITGTFSSSSPAPDFAWDLTGDMGTFLMELDESTGLVAKGTTLYLGAGSGIRARSLALGATDASGPHVLLAGDYSGNSMQDPLPVTTRPAAFIADFSDGQMMTFKRNWAKGFTTSDAIRATGIAYFNNRAYFTGTLAGTVALDDANLPFADNFMHPYLAILADVNTNNPSLVGFDVFPGFGEVLSGRPVNIAASSEGVALAGGWMHDVDFSTAPTMTGYLPSPEMKPSTLDAFVAKFALP